MARSLEIDRQQVGQLPARTVLSLFSDDHGHGRVGGDGSLGH